MITRRTLCFALLAAFLLGLAGGFLLTRTEPIRARLNPPPAGPVGTPPVIPALSGCPPRTICYSPY